MSGASTFRRGFGACREGLKTGGVLAQVFRINRFEAASARAQRLGHNPRASPQNVPQRRMVDDG